MTQTPPVSPDFAAMARETANRLSKDIPSFELSKAVYEGIVAALTLSHAVGRAEGLAEAANVALERLGDDRIGYAAGKVIATAIRALASDPVAGDQAPAPAPGLAAQEIERLKAIETAAREFGRHLTDTKSPMRYWPIWMDVEAALSAPRPAQAK